MGLHANFEIVLERPDRLVIKDLGPWDKHFTVTNDAEWVVSQVASRLNGRMLLYFDSEGELDQILVQDGRFAGFAHYRSTERIQ
jgi:hypothetical protein